MAVVIGGTAGAAFTGNCRVQTKTGPRSLRLDGVVPERHDVEASGLACRIRKEVPGGTLIVEILRDGQVVSRSSVSGGNASIAIAAQ